MAGQTNDKQDNTRVTDSTQSNSKQTVDATDTRKPGQRTMQQISPNGSVQTVNYYPAPRYNAADSTTRNAVRAWEQSRKSEDPGLPDVATDKALASARWMPMQGSVANMVEQLFPEDNDNQDAFDQHVFDIMTLNRDILRDDSSYTIGTMIRVP